MQDFGRRSFEEGSNIEIVVLGENDRFHLGGASPDVPVVARRKAKVADVENASEDCLKGLFETEGEILIEDERYGDHEEPLYRKLCNLSVSCEIEAGQNLLPGQLGEVLDDLFDRQARRKSAEHIAYSQPCPQDDGLSRTHAGIAANDALPSHVSMIDGSAR